MSPDRPPIDDGPRARELYGKPELSGPIDPLGDDADVPAPGVLGQNAQGNRGIIGIVEPQLGKNHSERLSRWNPARKAAATPRRKSPPPRIAEEMTHDEAQRNEPPETRVQVRARPVTRAPVENCGTNRGGGLLRRFVHVDN